MRVRSVPLIALTAWALAAPVDARTWTSAGGKQLEAELVDRKGGQVVLEKADGSRVSIAEQRLSAADQDYLRSLSPTAGPTAAPAATTEAVPASSEPTLAPGFVGRPDFDTRDGEVSAGTCFLVEYPGQAAPLLLTAHHLFGAAGGLKQEVPHDQMPTFARRAAFDDLLKLDDRGIQAVLREVQTDQLVIALKSADPDLREKILRNMSQRAAEGLREDLESRGPVKVSEVEAQQKEILKTVRRLAEEGQISIGGGGEDAFV